MFRLLIYILKMCYCKLDPSTVTDSRISCRPPKIWRKNSG